MCPMTISPVRPRSASCAQRLRRIGLSLMAQEISGGTILHFCGKPAATWFEFASHALQQATPYQLSPELVPITPNRFGVTGAPARRTELDCSRARHLFQLEQPDWRRALDDCVEEICLADLKSGGEPADSPSQAEPVPYRAMVPGIPPPRRPALRRHRRPPRRQDVKQAERLLRALRKDRQLFHVFGIMLHHQYGVERLCHVMQPIHGCQ